MGQQSPPRLYAAQRTCRAHAAAPGVGLLVGDREGAGLGLVLGRALGIHDGLAVGLAVGTLVVGRGVGRGVHTVCRRRRTSFSLLSRRGSISLSSLAAVAGVQRRRRRNRRAG